jgi:class 3 adenylate cyclase
MPLGLQKARNCKGGRYVAHGGQTFLSRLTADLVCASLTPRIELRDLGAHRLKDLQQPEQIFQLVVPGLPTHFHSKPSQAEAE